MKINTNTLIASSSSPPSRSSLTTALINKTNTNDNTTIHISNNDYTTTSRRLYSSTVQTSRRHDRASAFSKSRPTTKKKRREYNRKMKRRADEIARKNPPGSKAGPRREWAQNRWEQLLAHGNDDVDSNKSLPALPEGEEYTYEDAVIEDLIGNTSNLTSQPTPKPVYLGHRHREFYNRVADQMDEYRSQVRGDDKEDNTAGALKASISLPSDKDISNALRSYRDRHGTRQKPIGAAQALQHLLQDLGVPIKAFDEFTYTTLVMCCRTPQEGRRIFKLMRDNNHEISSYSWSILVDVSKPIFLSNEMMNYLALV